MSKYLDATGVSRLWGKMKTYIAEQISAASGSSEETGDIDTLYSNDSARFCYGFTLPSEGIYLLCVNYGGVIIDYAIAILSEDGSGIYSCNFIQDRTHFVQNTGVLEIVTNYDFDSYQDMITGSWKKLM